MENSESLSVDFVFDFDNIDRSFSKISGVEFYVSSNSEFLKFFKFKVVILFFIV